MFQVLPVPAEASTRRTPSSGQEKTSSSGAADMGRDGSGGRPAVHQGERANQDHVVQGRAAAATVVRSGALGLEGGDRRAHEGVFLARKIPLLDEAVFARFSTSPGPLGTRPNDAPQRRIFTELGASR